MDDVKEGPLISANEHVKGFSRIVERFPFLTTKRFKALLVVLVLLPLLGLLALRNRSDGGDIAAQGSSQGAITDDTHFYGDSEPVYPSREYIALDLAPVAVC